MQIKNFIQFINEDYESERGLFASSGNDKNDFLFSIRSQRDSDTIEVPRTTKKVAPGNNYNWQEFANQCQDWEHSFEVGRIKYGVTPEISFTIPGVAEITTDEYIRVEPIANLRSKDFKEGQGTNFSPDYYSGNTKGRGPAWMNQRASGSVKVNTPAIKSRMENIVGNSIRAAFVDNMDWQRLAATVQYKGQDPRIFDPSTNTDDLYQWVDSNSSLWNMSSFIENGKELLNSLQPAINRLKSELPSQIVCQVKTVKRWW